MAVTEEHSPPPEEQWRRAVAHPTLPVRGRAAATLPRYGRVAGVLIAVVVAVAAAGCTGATEHAATSSAAASSTLLSSGTGSVPVTAAAESGSSERPAQASSSAVASFQPIPADSLPFPQPGNSPFSDAHQQALQTVLNRSLVNPAATGVQGVTVAVVSPDGSWAGSAGVDGSASPMVPPSMVGIGSITKTVTAAEVLHLARLRPRRPRRTCLRLPGSPPAATAPDGASAPLAHQRRSKFH